MRTNLLFLFVVLSSIASGQIVVGEEGNMLIGDQFLSTNSSIQNEGNLEGQKGRILLTGQGTIETVRNINVADLNFIGFWNLSGYWRVLENLSLQSGTVYTSASDSLVLADEVNILTSESFVQGALYYEGTGRKFFPLGRNDRYLPIYLNNINTDSETIGVEAFIDQPALPPFPQDVAEVLAGGYWIIRTNGLIFSADVEIPLNEILIENLDAYTVIQAPKDLSILENLGNVSTSTNISSQASVTEPYVFIGKAAFGKQEVRIHNIVSHGNSDGKNDAFYIENAEQLQSVTYRLLDRNGIEVCRMVNFSNDPQSQSGCNLDQLPVGTYVAVVSHSRGDLTPTLITIID